MQRLLTLHSPLTQSQSPTSSPGTGDELPFQTHHLSLLLFFHRIYSYSGSDYEFLCLHIFSEVRGFRGQHRASTCTSLREGPMPGNGLCTHHSNIRNRQGTVMCRQESDPQPWMIPDTISLHMYVMEGLNEGDSEKPSVHFWELMGVWITRVSASA